MNQFSILIIDDASLIRVRIVHLLKENGNTNTIFHAANCAEGMQQLKKEKPAIVILDINLPDNNGIKLLQYIKENNPEAKTIILTSYGHSHYREACKALGAYDFIDKSLEFEKIPALINTIQSN
jgi:DNA-binding NarL/FixJ family response regulator